jgi:hypothetical protein
MATDYYQLRLQGLHQTEYNECVLHFRGTNLTVADYLTNASDLLTSFSSDLLAHWLALMPSSYQLLRATAKKASTGGGAEISTIFGYGTQTGAQSGGAASQQLCPVIRLIPGMGIKTAGKIFLPCIAESDIDGNVVSAGWLTNVDALLTPMVSGFGPGSIVWTSAIYSRLNNSFSETIAHDTSPIVGFQRRRQRAAL